MKCWRKSNYGRQQVGIHWSKPVVYTVIKNRRPSHLTSQKTIPTRQLLSHTLLPHTFCSNADFVAIFFPYVTSWQHHTTEFLNGWKIDNIASSREFYRVCHLSSAKPKGSNCFLLFFWLDLIGSLALKRLEKTGSILAKEVTQNCWNQFVVWSIFVYNQFFPSLSLV